MMRKFRSLAICAVLFLSTFSAAMPASAAQVMSHQAKAAVTAKKAKSITVTKVSIVNKNIVLNTGSSCSVIASVAPANATNKAILWSTSDKKVATVFNGKVTAVNAGSCKITAMSSNSKTASVLVTVRKPIILVKSVTLSSTFTAVTIKGTVKLTAKLNPVNATDKTVIWTSSNNKIATVDSNGRITGKATGNCKITAKASNGKFAICNVTVETPDD